MVIGKIKKLIEDESVRLQCTVSYQGAERVLWYSFDKNMECYLITEKYDGFLLAVLLLAMAKNEDIHIQGKISETLFYNLTQYYMDIVKSMHVGFNKIRITTEGFSNGDEYECEGDTLTGFSGGIDSFCTIHDHRQNNVPEAFKIKKLLFNNVGANGCVDEEKSRALFLKRYKNVKKYSQEAQIDVIKIDSNLSQVLAMDFQKTHVIRNISCVMLMQKLIAKYYYSSGYEYKDCYVGKSNDMACMDPFSIHLLSTESTQSISTGCQHSRVEKTRRVAQVAFSANHLKVCVSDYGKSDKNCSKCWKCSRTLITLDIMGKLNQYEPVFDLQQWQSVKKWYVGGVVLNFRNRKEPLLREIRKLAADEGYKFSTRDYVISIVACLLPLKIFQRLTKL